MPVVDEYTMEALEDYRSFLAKLNEKSIDTAGLKRLAGRCTIDSPLREVLLELPDKISRMDMMGLIYPLSTLAKREDRIRREGYR
ncbi:MAG: hypothetical protein ACLP9K_07045 [Nitrososphaerales archaeon]